jgi:hypothetical protein
MLDWGMFTTSSPIVLSEAERTELQRRARGRTLRLEDSQRARVILLLADGRSYSEIEERVDCSQRFIKSWRTRFLAERLDGLYARHKGRKPAADVDRLEAKILSATRKAPLTGVLIGAAASLPAIWVSRTCEWAGYGLGRGSSRIASNATWLPTIPTSRPRLLT